jgi:hypothetical protein
VREFVRPLTHLLVLLLWVSVVGLLQVGEPCRVDGASAS